MHPRKQHWRFLHEFLNLYEPDVGHKKLKVTDTLVTNSTKKRAIILMKVENKEKQAAFRMSVRLN